MKFYAWLTFFTGLLLSSLAGFFSIVGLGMVFAGSFKSVVALGAALEVSKLVAVSWLYRFRHLASRSVRMYFYASVTLLMVITSIGIFGYLSRAHVDLETTSITAQLSIDEINQRESALLQEQKQLSTELSSISTQSDKLIEQLGASNRLTRENGAVQVQRETSKRKDEILKELKRINDQVSAVKTEKITKQAEFSKSTADIGPLRYVAQAVYGNDSIETIQRAIVWLILLLMVVFDPMAVMLLIASSILFKEIERENATKRTESPVESILPAVDTLTSPVLDEAPGAVIERDDSVAIPEINIPKFANINEETPAFNLRNLTELTETPVINPPVIEKQTPAKILAAAKLAKPIQKKQKTRRPAPMIRASSIPRSLLSNSVLERESKKILDRRDER